MAPQLAQEDAALTAGRTAGGAVLWPVFSGSLVGPAAAPDFGRKLDVVYAPPILFFEPQLLRVEPEEASPPHRVGGGQPGDG